MVYQSSWYGNFDGSSWLDRMDLLIELITCKRRRSQAIQGPGWSSFVIAFVAIKEAIQKEEEEEEKKKCPFPLVAVGGECQILITWVLAA